jgi:short-subunit dehydrogenase
MTQIMGAAALITGAASGIGRALARELVRRGCDVAIADRDQAGLNTLEDELKGVTGKKVSVHPVDVADRRQMEALVNAAVVAHPSLNILINNAGVALFGEFHEVDLADMEWVMGINFWAVVYGTHFLLPHLYRQQHAHIVNLSSIFGIVAPPGQTAYSAAKFAVRGFSESLRHELETAKSSVHLSIVYPGGVATGIVRNSRVGAYKNDSGAELISQFDKFPQTTPQLAAHRICEGVERNEPRILFGPGSRPADLVQRLSPTSYWKVLSLGVNMRNKRSKSGDA